VTLADRFRTDFPFYARSVLKVLDRGTLVPFELRPAQVKLWAVLADQQDRGAPLRAAILKARKLGCSTMAQGLMVQRTTLIPNHSAITIAHNIDTAGAILRMAEQMYHHLPDVDDDELVLKPPIANRRRLKELRFGEPDNFNLYSGKRRGFGGDQSSLLVDTAKEFEAGRGFTFQSVHGSEVAFYPDLKRKLTSIANAVDHTDPNTMILLESTANGHNEFKELCDKAMAGEGDYPLVFLAWFDDPRYVRALTRREAQAFTVGEHKHGDEEHDLVANYQLSPEQLQWRRWAIDSLCQGDVNVFHQEYPSFPAEAFLASGQAYFGGILIQRAIRSATAQAEPKMIELKATGHETHKTRRGTVDVPSSVKASEGGPWELWTPPSEDGQYVIGVDPASGEDDDEQAYFAIVVIDHATREQCAQLEVRTEPDLVAQQLMLACLYFSRHRRPWLAIERTGGFGLSLIDALFHEYGYRQMYTKRRGDRPTGTYTDRLGWDTTRVTKGLLHEEALALLREGTHGIKSVRLARQMETYVRRGSGRVGPQSGATSDLLLAWMIAQTVAAEKAPRVERSTRRVGTRRRTNSTRRAVTGY
jgi:hypothetical protein